MKNCSTTPMPLWVRTSGNCFQTLLTSRCDFSLDFQAFYRSKIFKKYESWILNHAFECISVDIRNILFVKKCESMLWIVVFYELNFGTGRNVWGNLKTDIGGMYTRAQIRMDASQFSWSRFNTWTVGVNLAGTTYRSYSWFLFPTPSMRPLELSNWIMREYHPSEGTLSHQSHVEDIHNCTCKSQSVLEK